MTSSAQARQVGPQQPPEERIILEPSERRETVLRVIRSARQSLALSMFRCTDFKVFDELAEARKRGVRVELLLTQRAKGWKKRLRRLGAFLESMGAELHRYSVPQVKYHAKYLVADDGPAVVASLNFTRKCFESTCDFLLVTHDPEVASGLKRLFEADCRAPESSLLEGLSERLIVGPERARAQLTALLQQARQSIRIIDHRVADPAMLALLEAKQAEGVAVEVLGRGALGTLISHGKMILVDEHTAVIGSIALSPPSLDSRREVAVVVRDPGCVGQLNDFFQRMSAGPAAPAFAAATAGTDTDADENDEEDEDDGDHSVATCAALSLPEDSPS